LSIDIFGGKKFPKGSSGICFVNNNKGEQRWVMETENQRPKGLADQLITDMSYLSVVPSGEPSGSLESITESTNDDVDTIFTELDEGIKDWRLFWDGINFRTFPKESHNIDDEHMLLDAMEQGIIP
jgi:hypothetical protein